jgi:cell division transport system ATP-binding protein
MSTNPVRAAREEGGASAQASPVVRFDQVSLVRGPDTFALRAASFALAPGSFHILVGAGGSGKSSLLRLIAMAERPTQGVAQIFGRDVATLSRKEKAQTRRRIGSVLYPAVFLEHLSVWDNAALAPRVTDRDPRAYEGEVDAVLKWMGLAKLAGAVPAELSAADRHRLAIARAVIGRPEVLLVDEPAGGLEPDARERALKLVKEIHGAGVTAVMVSGDDAFAIASGFPLIRLQGGHVSLAEPDSR